MSQRLTQKPSRKSARLILLGLAILTIFLIWKTFASPQTYPLLTCQQHLVSYQDRTLTGIEDMAYDATQDRLYLSTYDRRKSETGGVYHLQPTSFNALSQLDISPAVTPHGIDLVRQGETLYLTLIDRDLSEAKVMSAQLRQFRLGPDTSTPVELALAAPQGQDWAAFCNANDVITRPHLRANDPTHVEFFVTSDHKACTVKGRKRENLFSPDKASLITYSPEQDPPITRPLEGLYFANGIAALPNQGTGRDLYISETRKKRISVYSQDKAGDLQLKHRIALPGGPDNLSVNLSVSTRNTQPAIWAALHPNLIRFGAFRAGWIKTAPSRVARISLQGMVDIYDIPKDIISGATVAIAAGQSLYLGAAFDDGLAVCDLPKDKT